MNASIEFFKSVGEPHYFGLGFIQLKVDYETRYHFYHPELMPILDEEEIHDHRYDFISTVIKGSLYNEVFYYEEVSKSDHELQIVSCKKEDAGKGGVTLYSVCPIALAKHQTTAGSRYSMSHKAFHRIKYFEPTITCLTRGQVVKDYARVIKKKGEPDVCPFSKKMSSDECWDVIGKILAA